MDEQFRQYRFARTEGQKITDAELAALEFYWNNRQQVRHLILNHSPGPSWL